MSNAGPKEVLRQLNTTQKPSGCGKETAAQPGTKGRRQLRGHPDPAGVLHQDALAALRILKREHHALFETSPDEFRRQVRKAQGRVLRLKRGPKPDQVIASAARAVAAGAKMEDAFEDAFGRRYLGLKEKDPDLHAMVLESFRTKVNACIRRHPRLKRLRDQRRMRTQPPVDTP
jgi:hypothetical protein